MKFLAIIPARYASSRFPGKPLAKICGEEMIVRVCRRVAEAGIDPLVATDDKRIYDCVESAGFRAVMTSEHCGSGTERVEEAYRNVGSDADVIINVQGDEPFIRKDQIEKLKSLFENVPETKIATLVKRYDPDAPFAGLKDPNLVKVVVADSGEALYFSRSVIPYVRNAEEDSWLEKTCFLTHIGIYAYKAATLKELVSLPVSSLEKAESLEQLRWLQNGYKILTAVTDSSTIGIDTPADLEAAEKYLKSIGE
ncbi:MAG: 3-deoxy-manno-octulosonate cytidylyltransferase [Muribaculaceae bacterium]|nr:3-deoxy-manno-octulosonate cytidylyltransferase [Muribaculaceae bacterium]